MTDPSAPKSRDCLRDNKPNNNGEVDCPWHINSPEHQNCFWLFVMERSAPDGSMPELVQSEIAKLLGWSNTKTHFALKQAMAELVTALTLDRADQLIANVDDPSVQVDLDIDVDRTYGTDDQED